MKKQRCIVLLDGSNFYFKLKDIKLQSIATVANCSKPRLLTKEDLLNLIKDKG